MDIQTLYPTRDKAGEIGIEIEVELNSQYIEEERINEGRKKINY